MAGDYSRKRFDASLDLSGVFMQQGRVQLDADWNELVEILDRRFRAETVDIVGRCTVPKQTPDGFKISLSGDSFEIGIGRAYVERMSFNLTPTPNRPVKSFARLLIRPL